MKKQTIIRAAILAALAIAAVVLGIIAFTPHNSSTVPIEIQPAATPMPIIASTPPPKPAPAPAVTPEESTPALTPTPKQNSGAFFTLNIKDKKVSVAYGVDENTLKKSPGWLTTSALPGGDGMCVVYGHRNRTHLRILEKVKLGDHITVTMQDGTTYTYTVSNIKIYERTEDFRLPPVEGKTLVLATCYPFRYSGHAPGKCVVTAVIA